MKTDDFSPAARPFSSAANDGRISADILDSALVANFAIDAAKRILLENRVQNFEASDVVALARLIIEES